MPDDIPLISSLNTGPYSFSHLPRRNTNNYGGGIGIIFKSSLHVSPLRDHNNDHSEAFTCSISPPHSKTFKISLFYRPPSSSIPLFLSEFYSFTHLMSESNIIIGDFNIATNLSTNLNLYSIYCHPPILNFVILTPHTNMVIHSISSFPISHPT